jgi:hypothetical protein
MQVRRISRPRLRRPVTFRDGAGCLRAVARSVPVVALAGDDPVTAAAGPTAYSPGGRRGAGRRLGVAGRVRRRMMRPCWVSSRRCRRVRASPTCYSDLLGHLATGPADHPFRRAEDREAHHPGPVPRLGPARIARSGHDHVARSHPGQPGRLRRSISKSILETRLKLGLMMAAVVRKRVRACGGRGRRRRRGGGRGGGGRGRGGCSRV